MKMTEDELRAALADPAGDAARRKRIAAESDAGFRLLSGRPGKAVTVFGSARPGPDDPRYQAAQALGSRLAGTGFAVITGGGPGLMGGQPWRLRSRRNLCWPGYRTTA